MIIAVTVVKDDLFLYGFFSSFSADVNGRPPCRHRWDRFRIPAFRRRFYSQLECVQKTACITVCRIDKVFKRTFFKFYIPVAVSAFCIRECHVSCFFKVFFCKRLELEYPASAYKCFVYFKKGIFGSSTNQNDCTVFHPGK